MSVKIITPPFLKFKVKEALVAVEGMTVNECLNHLIQRFPETKELLFDEYGNLHEYIQIYINGASSYPEELGKPVNDGDLIDIMMLVTGG